MNFIDNVMSGKVDSIYALISAVMILNFHSHSFSTLINR